MDQFVQLLLFCCYIWWKMCTFPGCSHLPHCARCPWWYTVKNVELHEHVSRLCGCLSLGYFRNCLHTCTCVWACVRVCAYVIYILFYLISWLSDFIFMRVLCLHLFVYNLLLFSLLLLLPLLMFSFCPFNGNCCGICCYRPSLVMLLTLLLLLLQLLLLAELLLLLYTRHSSLCICCSHSCSCCFWSGFHVCLGAYLFIQFPSSECQAK